jgi:hypothetical protein
MINNVPISVGEDIASVLQNYLTRITGEPDIPIRDGKLALGIEHVAILRSTIYQHLNALETVASAWRYNIADRDIIEEEFGSILSPEKGVFDFRGFRLTSGIYPSLSALETALSSRQNDIRSKPHIE